MPELIGRVDPWGAMIDVKVMQTRQRVEALKRAGRSYPSPTTVLALIDTGASCSALDHRIIAALNLQYRGTTSIHTPSTGAAFEIRNQFDLTFVLAENDPTPLMITRPVIECDFAGQGFFALLGRDVLMHCTLTYDGPAGMFSLKF